MKQMRIMMGMPITVEISYSDSQLLSYSEEKRAKETINKVFDYFNYVDHKFSTYKSTSEISGINRDELNEKDYSGDMKEVLNLCEISKKETNGYFDIRNKGKIDPSGLVKGWAIWKAAQIIEKTGLDNYYIEAGGDIQAKGKNSKKDEWKIGIRNPWGHNEIIKIITINNKGVATSGTYIRGQHIYNPKTELEIGDEIVSITVIGPNIFEADRMATAALAMGYKGIEFIQNLPLFEAYMINKNGQAWQTTGFKRYETDN